MKPPPNTCRQCGACCSTCDVLLGEGEADFFDSRDDLRDLTYIHVLSNGRMLRFMRRDPVTERCVALEGPLEQARCRIYDDRPALCRMFTPQSSDCLEARRAALTHDNP